VSVADPPPPVTVVVCSRDRAAQLAAALPAARAALREGDRLLVVDSASRDGSTAAVARDVGADCVRAERPGLSVARNLGVAHARSPLVAFTDDDCAPAPDWLEAIRAGFADPRVGFVTGRVVVTAARGPTSTLAREEAVRYDRPRDPAGMGHGANMAFRRAALEAAGPFDEALGAGARFRSGEDLDMLFRVLLAGWEGRYEPRALVTHDQWRGPREVVRVRYGYGLGNGALRAKTARRHGRPGWHLLARSAWDFGVKNVYWALRRRAALDVAGALSWGAGMAVGVARGWRAPLRGDAFAPCSAVPPELASSRAGPERGDRAGRS
jgi:glycosyltransferase involved in cell wall biosynthesis